MAADGDNFKVGDRVVFATGPLGVLSAENMHKFREETVTAGDEGRIASYPGQMPDGWLLVSVELDGDEEGFVPVDPRMIERVNE